MSDLTTQEAAEILDIDPRTVQRWAKDGTIVGARKRGRDWSLPEKSVRELAAERTIEQEAGSEESSDLN